MIEALEAALLAAHSRRDLSALAELYTEAADLKEAAQDIDAACFYLTHAYVFALDAGHPSASSLRDRLVAFGRES